MTAPSASANIDIHIPDLRLHGFKIHRIPRVLNGTVSAARRDFYKLGLVTGDMRMMYGDRPIDLTGQTLFFVNPHVPHTVTRRSRKVSGYACLFTEAFIAGRERTDILKSSPLTDTTLSPAIHLDDAQAAFLTGIFQKMQAIHGSTYPHKNDVLRSCLTLILHEAQRLQPAPEEVAYKNAATRITHLFLDLLERQFPIETPGQPLRLRTPHDYAAGLSVHVNYLNRTIKEATGRPTSAHIAERITAEAKALLLYTDWSIADIAYGLGFDYPAYFNNYFRRMTGTTPLSLRRQKV